MKHNTIFSINSLLQNSPIIAQLYNKLNQLEQLNKFISHFLPPMLAKNCRASNIRDGILILTTTSPVWNHQINFLKIDLLTQLRKNNPEWASLSSILVKTEYLAECLTNTEHKTLKTIKNFTVSKENIKAINNIADNQISHQPLASALKQLAKKFNYSGPSRGV